MKNNLIEFIDFLHRNNALYAYIENSIAWSGVIVIRPINIAFDWKASPEGADYWKKLHLHSPFITTIQTHG